MNPHNDLVNEHSNPPKPALAFRVGVVGHRPNRLKQENTPTLATVIKDILSTIKDQVNRYYLNNKRFFKATSPILRALSPLAEGSDRIFAEQALDLGFHLCCPMPFFQNEYEKDFTTPNALEKNSIKRFVELLQRAEKETSLSIFELDGNRDNTGAAYGAAGRVVLNQSDILMVVWDGECQGKPGGTEETMAEAKRQGVPLVWIDAHNPTAWQIVDETLDMPEPVHDKRMTPTPPDNHSLDQVRNLVESIIKLPELSLKQNEKVPSPPHHYTPSLKAIVTFFSERKPRLNYGWLWQSFKGIIADGKRPTLNFQVPGFESSVIRDWPNDDSTTVAGLVNWLRPFYAWADKLAVSYGDTYRSAFIFCYLLAALAVGFALGPLAFGLIGSHHHTLEAFFIILECIAIIAILLIVWIGNTWRWHERWIDYRMASELVRHLRLVVPLGGGRSFPQIPAHLTGYGHPAGTWMAWYIRAVERDLGQPSAKMDRNHIEKCLAQIKELLDGQIRYHRDNAKRSHRIENRLHKAGIWLMAMTLAACVLHLITSSVFPIWAGLILTFFCGFFPALGAAMAGINNQGEFRRVEKRSEAMSLQIPKLREELDQLEEKLDGIEDGKGALLSVQLAALASRAAQLMVNEVLDWRVVFMDRPLNPPA